jgi:hypothetical protein
MAGNERTDQFVKIGAEYPFIGTKPAYGISIGVAKKATRGWKIINHTKYCVSLTGLRQVKGLIRGPSAKRAKEVLKLNKNQIRWIL